MYGASCPSPAVITALERFAGFVSMSVFASGGRMNVSGNDIVVPPQPASTPTKTRKATKRIRSMMYSARRFPRGKGGVDDDCDRSSRRLRALLVPHPEPTLKEEPPLDLESLGWNAFFADSFHPHEQDGLAPARVAVEHRSEYIVYAEQGELKAE